MTPLMMARKLGEPMQQGKSLFSKLLTVCERTIKGMQDARP